MQMQPVSSSMIKSIGYDPETQTAQVTFSSGATWAYEGMSQDDWDSFNSAGSKGSYFLNNVKGLYSERRVG